MGTDDSNSREQLLRELIEARGQLAAQEQRCLELSEELALLKGKKQSECDRLISAACHILSPRETEEALRQCEESIHPNFKSVLSPDADQGAMDLADLIDAEAFQKLMEEFYAVARIPMSIIDIKGRVLVGVGWQDICTQFHRMHPEAGGNCLESDTVLSAGLAQGEHRLYKCKNNMWDMVTPIMVAGQHVGNIFTGQFFFTDETVDRELFRAQARKYGFDEEGYLAALDRVPRLSRETVDRGMRFFLKLAEELSKLGHSNLNLARLLYERALLTDSLLESRSNLEAALASMTDAVFISDAQGRFVNFNEAFATFHRFRNKEECSKSFAENLEILDLFTPNGKQAPPDQRPVARALRGETATLAEYKIKRKDTGDTWFGSYSFGPIRNKDDEIIGSAVVARDITKHKRAEAQLRQQKSILDSVMRTTDVMLVLLDPQFNFVWVNQAYAATCQMKPDEMVGKNHFALYPQDENEAIFRRVRDSGEGVFFKDKPFVFPDQPERGVTYWDWSLTPVKEESGTVTGLVFSLRETTKFKQAADDLRRSSQFPEENPNPVLRVATNGSLLYANAPARDWLDKLGWKADEQLPALVQAVVTEARGNLLPFKTNSIIPILPYT